MILRFHPAASEDQRRAVRAVLEDMEIEARELEEILILGRPLAEEEAVLFGSMEGVAALSLADPKTLTAREDFLRWTASACFALGVLVLLGSNLPPGLGPPADPLLTPADLRPAWPLLAWHALVDLGPAWLPVGLLILLAGAALFAWPLLGRRLAERRPGLHAALGAAALLAGLGLALAEVMR